jgi:hypothetical protein
MPAELKTRYVFSLAIEVAVPVSAGEIGHGTRRVVPITGGRVFGELSGAILPFGADFQMLRPDGKAELEAKYAFRLDDGAVIYIENIGMRVGPRDLTDRLARGELVDPSLIYFRSVPRFETGDPTYRWLMDHLFVGVGARYPDRVEIDVHQVL